VAPESTAQSTGFDHAAKPIPRLCADVRQEPQDLASANQYQEDIWTATSVVVADLATATNPSSDQRPG
jgi:hypothetical protein